MKGMNRQRNVNEVAVKNRIRRGPIKPPRYTVKGPMNTSAML